jgi:hypothetical membrane protein
MRYLALGGAVGSLIMTVMTILVGTLRPGYDHLDQFISELGATGTPYSGLMNYGGFVPTGLAFLAFAVSTRSLVPQTRSSVLATVLLVLFSGGGITAGLASCDVGCPQGSGSLSNVVHDTVSPLAFLSLIVAAAALGVYFRRAPEWRSFWLYSIATSIASVGLMIALVSSLESRALTGLWQRLLLATLFVWSTLVSVRLHRLLSRRE